MQIGIMDGTVVRPTLSETLDAIVDYGMYFMQFGLGRVGLPELPEQIDTELCDQIRKEFDERNINMAAISGTFNMIHPDLQQRADGLRRLRVLVSACGRVGTSVITLCTGTRDSGRPATRQGADIKGTTCLPDCHATGFDSRYYSQKN